MRKHFYLVTEHENEERVGCVQELDSRMETGEKNTETTIHTFDEETGDFHAVGKRVGMGYVDFEDEADYEDRIEDAIRRKLGEIDESHLTKAGLDPEVVVA